ncbi:AP-1 complex subunit mu [Fistulifera solaris]|uniref:AP-1 complex subunit mu n=2 Tax=Fistulifera solaris TaxID=1519565 RepID=A0A1Z5K9D6_FISSO|nr:AP-1 complex subunit mu [Fistulifera solaris]|eukprot:GAX22558.1 AP-1 complex subunit mu [Fistulifera solaris]
MVASAVFITDLSGKMLISRNYRGDVPLNKAVERFTKYLLDTPDEQKKPIFFTDVNGEFLHEEDVGGTGIGGETYVYIALSNLYMCAVTIRNSNAALTLTFLYRLSQVFKDYFGTLEEESIRDNFVIIYELLDETMDFGLPQSLDSTILRSFITTGANRMAEDTRSKPPVALTNAVSWRAEGIKHKKNEIFLDVVEKLNLLVAANGTVLHSEILGAVKMKSFLSGMPELKLGLNDKLMFEATGRANQARGKSVELEDIKFHQCVRLARFENDRTISFIPPDGEFDLMTYRLNTHVKPLIWVEAVVEPHKGSRIEYMVKTRSQFKSRSVANNVEIIIPVPPDVDSPSFKSSVGTVTYLPDKDAVVWKIKQYHGGREFLMRAHFGLPSISANDQKAENSWKAPIRVQFEIPYFTVSGIQVRYLKIIEKSGYQALPWVRYITANGDYQLRMA